MSRCRGTISTERHDVERQCSLSAILEILRNLFPRIALAGLGLLLIGSAAGCDVGRPQPPPAYGVKVRYARGQLLTFPDLTVEFMGEREEKSPYYPRNFRYYDFRVRQGDQGIIVSWTEGTGLIGPSLFELGGNHYRLERVMSDTLGRLDENELVLWKDRAQP